MPVPLRVLILEDSPVDAELEVRELRRAGFDPKWETVETEEDYVARLDPSLDLIIADYRLPRYDGERALARLRETGYDIPFIVVSGAVGEERAVALMQQGAADYLLKDRLTRLGQAVLRALEQRRVRAEKARADQVLRDTVEQLKHERELRELFVSTITHDLRAPLRAARLGTEMASARELLDAAARRRILANLDRLDTMIQTMLDATLVRAGERLPVKPAPCDLSRTLDEAVAAAREVHGDRFRVIAPPRVDGYWDCHAVHRILDNLLGNAVKHGDPGADITVTLAEAGDEVRLSVHNQGPAIPANEQQTMFEPFRRSAGAVDRRGWGIGLTVVRGMAEAHGGRVTVDSAPERGTTFTVSLPRDARL